MDYFNFKLNELRAQELSGATAFEAGVWFKLMLHSLATENSGVLRGAKKWRPLQWLAVVGIEAQNIELETDLWTWEGEDLHVWGYPVQTQQKLEIQRGQGHHGLKGGRPKKQPETLPETHKGKERKGKEDKGKEDKGKELLADKPPGEGGQIAASYVHPAEPETPVPAQKKKGGRPRNELFDALARVCGIAEVTKSAGGRIAKALAEIRAATPGVTVAEIEARARRYRAQWPNAELSATALSANWGRFASAKKENGGLRGDAIREPHWDWRETAAALQIPVAPGEHWSRLERAWQVRIWRAANFKQPEGTEQS